MLFSSFSHYPASLTWDHLAAPGPRVETHPIHDDAHNAFVACHGHTRRRENALQPVVAVAMRHLRHEGDRIEPRRPGRDARRLFSRGKRRTYSGEGCCNFSSLEWEAAGMVPVPCD